MHSFCSRSCSTESVDAQQHLPGYGTLNSGAAYSAPNLEAVIAGPPACVRSSSRTLIGTCSSPFPRRSRSFPQCRSRRAGREEPRSLSLHVLPVSEQVAFLIEDSPHFSNGSDCPYRDACDHNHQDPPSHFKSLRVVCSSSASGIAFGSCIRRCRLASADCPARGFCWRCRGGLRRGTSIAHAMRSVNHKGDALWQNKTGIRITSNCTTSRSPRT